MQYLIKIIGNISIYRQDNGCYYQYVLYCAEAEYVKYLFSRVYYAHVR